MTARKTRMMDCPTCKRKTKFRIFPKIESLDAPYSIYERDYREYKKTIKFANELPKFYIHKTHRACIICEDCFSVFDELTMKRICVSVEGHAKILLPIVENGVK